jgi:hypothetical protein
LIAAPTPRGQGDGERVTAQHDQRDQPPDCGVAVDVGAHKLAPSGSARPSALDLMRKWAADAAALKADRAAPQLRFRAGIRPAR